MSLLAFLAATASAQVASDPWRTVETEHFQVFYPAAAEPWTLDAVSRLEEWHARVIEEVGWLPSGRIRAIVIDPYSDANGSALPLMGRPRTTWYATSPDAASGIGHYRSWSEVLIVHEDAHLIHLLRESRNPVERALGRISGIGPLAMRAPRWVIEGYATVVEARLTGFGRPNSAARSSWLSRLAQEGQLPGYHELNASSRWGGGSFAYLVGSAYLEWLEDRAGRGALRDLWARMSSRETRSFDEAFEGVFGDPPSVLYARFTAELTAASMALEPDTDDPAAALFLELGRDVGPPALSPDGATLVVTHRAEKGPPILKGYTVAVDEEARDAREEEIAERIRKDPEDIAPVPPAHPPHATAFQRSSWTAAPRAPRFLSDGSALVYGAAVRDLTGRYRFDVFRYDIASKRVDRITRDADVRSPDPSPDGTWVVGVRQDFGLTHLVRVDLSTGAWRALTESVPGTIVDGPRLSSDGRRLAWLENRGRGFGVVVLDLETQERFRLEPGPSGPFATALAFGPDGKSLYATLGDSGSLQIHEVWTESGSGRGQLTASRGGAFFPEPDDDGGLYYLSAGFAGLDVHHVSGASTQNAAPAPAERPPVAPPLPTPVAVTPSTYALGPAELRPLLGGAIGSASGHGQFEVGARIGDPVGRSEVLLLAGSSAARGTSGGRAAASYRGLPVTLALDGYVGGDDAFGTRRGGFLFEGNGEIHGASSRLRVAAGGLVERPLHGDLLGDRDLVYFDVGGAWSEPRTRMFGASLVVRGTLGEAAGGPSSLLDLGASVHGLRDLPIRVAYDLGTTSGGSGFDAFTVGGVATSLVPPAANHWRVVDPAFAPGVISGPWHDRAELSVGSGLQAFGVRHRAGTALGSDAVSAVGVRSVASFEREPFGGLPSGQVEAGVACRVEWPGRGLASVGPHGPGSPPPRPCTALADYAGWVSFTWSR